METNLTTSRHAQRVAWAMSGGSDFEPYRGVVVFAGMRKGLAGGVGEVVPGAMLLFVPASASQNH